MDRITLAGIRCEGRLGVSEEERHYPQMLELDIVVEADLAGAARSDALEDTIDYRPLVEVALETVGSGSHRLLERLAGVLVERLLETSPAIEAVTVRVRKLAVPLDVDMDHAEVELRRQRP